MNLLITGAGLIGTHTAKQAAADGHHVVLYDLNPDQDYIDAVAGTERITAVRGDLRDLPALMRALKHHQIDALVHTAGLIGDKVRENSWTGTTNNILGTINVLEAAQIQNLQRVVYVSTFGVYKRDEIIGERIRESDPAGRHNLYATTKYCSEQLVQTYATHYGLDSVILRPSAIFGHGSYSGGSTVGMVLHDLVSQLAQGDHLTLKAGHFGAKEYLYGKDCGTAVWLACQAQSLSRRIYNIGSGTVTSLAELLEIVARIRPDCQVSVSGESKRTGPGGNLPLDISAAEADLGFKPEFSLETALQDYLRFLTSASPA